MAAPKLQWRLSAVVNVGRDPSYPERRKMSDRT